MMRSHCTSLAGRPCLRHGNSCLSTEIGSLVDSGDKSRCNHHSPPSIPPNGKAALNHSAPQTAQEFEPDPLFVASLREGKWILLMWIACFAWTQTVCLNFGYPDSVDPANFPTILGIPAWVAWGIAFPWLLANIVTIWFCLTQMEDADLGSDPEDSAADAADGARDV